MAAAAREPERRSFDLLDILKYIGSPIAIGTALLFYFGWVRSNAQAQEFGVDVSVFEMSTQDIVLRSINVLFIPLIALLLAGLLLLRIHPWLRANARPTARVLRLSWILVPVGLLIVALNYFAGWLLLPVWVLMAVAGMAYGARLTRQARGEDGSAPLAQTLLVGALLLVILFWVTERFASVGGSALADDLMRTLDQRSPVSVFSESRLHIEASGVSETMLAGPGSKYGYRYDGLYLLQRSGEKYFLLNDGWTGGAGRLVILPDDDSIRLEFGTR